jgi:hypothetical protein
MNYVFIGSYALRKYYEYRSNADVDVVCVDIKNPPKVYILPTSHNVDKVKFEYHNDKALLWLLENCNTHFPTPDMLYTIKVSHSFWDIHWDKTMHDIKFMQKQKCKLIPEFFDILYSSWSEKYKVKKVNLNVNNDDFFNEYIDREFNHDFLHNALAYEDEPMFNKIKKDISKAFISRKMFFDLSYERQINTCREEIQVIALERELIPVNFKKPLRTAYRRSLKALITHMTTGWFAKYLVENYNILSEIDRDFVNIFKIAANNKNNEKLWKKIC